MRLNFHVQTGMVAHTSHINTQEAGGSLEGLRPAVRLGFHCETVSKSKNKKNSCIMLGLNWKINIIAHPSYSRLRKK